MYLINFQSIIAQKPQKQEEDKGIENEELQNKGVSIIIADWQGTIHAFNKVTPRLFHVDEGALRGKNFFQLMSAYSRRYCYETFGNNIFKTFKQMTKSIRYSLPHMDDVDFEHFNVMTSKISLVKPKVSSPLSPEHYMVRICTRISSEESSRKLFNSYCKARSDLREHTSGLVNFTREIPLYQPVVPSTPYAPSKKSAFNTCSTKPMY